MTANPAKVVVLGVDAASPALLEQWAADGALPVLHSLAKRGLTAQIGGLDGFFVGATWPTLSTGVGPGTHGIHYLTQLEPGTYAYRRMADGALGARSPFWARLGRAGRRVAVMDVPLSVLEPGLNGVQVVEWGAHDAVYGFEAWPTSLRDEILATVGPHPLGPSCDGARPSVADVAAFVDRLVRGVDAKTRLTRSVLAQGGWDLLVQVFTEAHCAGHQCWHLHDPAHPAHDAGVAEAVGDPLLTVLGAIDEAIGAIVDDAGDAFVLVLTAHGMSHSHGSQLLLPEILGRLGLSAPLMPPSRSVVGNATSAAWHRLPPALRARLGSVRARVTREGGASPLPSLGVDPAASRCFVVGNGQAVGGIRLNLVGREPAGLVERGDEELELVDELSRELLALRDERTGRPAVRRVVRSAALYDGPMLDHLPDVLVEWNDELPIGSAGLRDGYGARVRLTSPQVGVVEALNHWGRSGEHRPGGLLIAAGGGIRGGRLAREVALVDLAPTLAGLLGISLTGLDGEPVAEIVTAAPA